MRTVEVVDYDASWPARFEAERAAIAGALGDVVVAVHHIGSTSVPGLAAKPVIDVLVEVRDLDALDARASAMEALGYEAKGEYGIARRRYFRRGGDMRTHHVHAFAAGDEHVVRHLAFRDYLRAHADVAAEYGALKHRVADEAAHDVDAYCDGKDAFVQHHEALAVAWAKAR